MESLLSLIIFTPVLYGYIYAVEKGGDYFFIYVEIFVCILTYVMMIIYPTLIAPLFNKFEELEDGELKESINELALSIDFPLKKIYKMDGSKRSAHSNAYFFGFWKNK